jgi:hypothetical protein
MTHEGNDFLPHGQTLTTNSAVLNLVCRNYRPRQFIVCRTYYPKDSTTEKCSPVLPPISCFHYQQGSSLCSCRLDSFCYCFSQHAEHFVLLCILGKSSFTTLVHRSDIRKRASRQVLYLDANQVWEVVELTARTFLYSEMMKGT